ncbi:MAG: Superoxide dismutase [candidate division TM6 bacterium GW2011_GWF2_43_17]|nr:MAG: Superoxide dismutase [candidate division TM6 bacterium GW2011_GWF2_43_17]HAU30029.1 superoxide dismutase [Candidatus Dependentiae bacterium]
MAFKLPELHYSFDALTPCFDAHMVEVHYTKHHQGYVDKLNAALADFPEWQSNSLDSLVLFWEQLPLAIQQVVRNNAGGHWAHTFFWNGMCPGGAQVSKSFEAVITKDFSSFENFKELFLQEAAKFFGSGWTWLALDMHGNLRVYSTPNHDVPQRFGFAPLLVVDLWEHAYYLRFENRRPEFLTAWWNLVDWNVVEKQYQQASFRKDI